MTCMPRLHHMKAHERPDHLPRRVIIDHFRQIGMLTVCRPGGHYASSNQNQGRGSRSSI